MGDLCDVCKSGDEIKLTGVYSISYDSSKINGRHVDLELKLKQSRMGSQSLPLSSLPSTSSGM